MVVFRNPKGRIPGAYVSADELEQAEAARRGYRQVVAHPSDLDPPAADGVLVIDFDHLLFDDIRPAVQALKAAAAAGAVVGVHTYNPHRRELAALKAELPALVVRPTHRRTGAKLRRALAAQVASGAW